MEGRYLWVEPRSFAKVAGSEGKHLHWTTDLRDELPIFMSNAEGAHHAPLTFNQYFDNTLRQGAKKPALRYKVGEKYVSWTFEEYHRDAMHFACSMVKLGIPELSTLNVIGFNSPQWVIGFAGGMFAGCVSVGVYATNSPEACEYIAEHSETELVLVQNEAQLKKYLGFWHKLPRIKAFVVYWPGKELEELRRGKSNIYTWDEFLNLHTDKEVAVVQERLRNITPSRCASIVYTSGTTGPPKGVLLSHDNVMWTARSLIDGSQMLSDEERLVSYLPLSHVAAQEIDIFGSLYARALVTFADENALQGTLINTLVDSRPTFFFGVPRVYEKFEERIRAVGASKTGIQKIIADWAKRAGAEHTINNFFNKPTSTSFSIANRFIFSAIKERMGLDQCRVFLVGAAPISRSCLEYFLSLNIPIMNAYGMSESSAPATSNSKRKCSIYSAGHPMQGTDLVIKDLKGQVVPVGTRGEVCFRGRNKFMGYFKNEKATKDTIDSDGFIHSGDEGVLSPEGFLTITGRFKELIITAGGENIPPVLIEDAVKERCKAISNAFLVGEARKFLAILISFKTLPNPDGSFGNQLTPEVVALANQLGFKASTTEELVSNAAVHKYIEEVLADVNKKSTSRAQEIKRFRFLTQDFSIPGGEFTPTMKIKRKFVNEKYAAVIEEMYLDPKI